MPVGQGGVALPVIQRGQADQRQVPLCECVQPGFQGIHRAKEDQRTVADLPDGSDGRREVSPRGLHSESPQGEVDPDIIHTVGIGLPHSLFQSRQRFRVPHPQE